MSSKYAKGLLVGVVVVLVGVFGFLITRPAQVPKDTTVTPSSAADLQPSTLYAFEADW